MPRARIPRRLGRGLGLSSQTTSWHPIRLTPGITPIRHGSTFTAPTKYPDPALYNPSLLPPRQHIPSAPSSLIQSSTVPAHILKPSVPIILQSFPSGEPLSVLRYPATHLHLPLRRDLLQRAVIFEANRTRQGTHSTKWRSAVHGSGRKLRRQKGAGKARVGDKKSPSRKGGGVAHGPVDRDHSTGLPRKIYDRAWRTALSHRYRRAQLIVVDGKLSDAWESVSSAAESTEASEAASRPEGVIRLHEIFRGSVNGSNGGHTAKLTTLYVALEGDPDPKRDALHAALTTYTPRDRVRYVHIPDDTLDVRGRPLRARIVDVKNLLESSRIVIERAALDALLAAHQADLGRVGKSVDVHAAKLGFEADAPAMERAVAEYRAIREREAEEKRIALEEERAERKRGKVGKTERTLKMGGLAEAETA